MGQTVYTIGHSTHSLVEFVSMLEFFQVKLLLDIRGLPGSNKFPQFNKENLQQSLPEHNVEYRHLPALGGRRPFKKTSRNNRWRNKSFRAYADYMETQEFAQAVTVLEQLARQKTTAYMCAEVLWWRCHRSMVSDYLKTKGWEVLHIMALGKVQPHTYTAPAIIKNAILSYSDLD